MTEQRDGWPSQSRSRCSTCSPNKHVLVQGQRGGGCWLPGPPGTLAPLLLRTGGAAWLRLPGQRLLVGWGMMAAAPPCCPAWEEECRARQVSLCVLWGERSRCRQAGAAGPGAALALVVKGLYLQPLGFACTPGPSLALTPASMCLLVLPCYITLI